MKNSLHILFFLFTSTSNAQLPIVPLSAENTSTNEPSISIHPKKINYQFAGSNVNLIYTSTDYGLSWSQKTLSSKFGFYGDPVVYISSKGEYMICHLAKNESKEYPEMFDRIVFQKSTDFGQTFSEGTSIGYREGKMQDKPWFCVDEAKKSTHKGNIYITWTEFDKYKSADTKDSSRIRFSYSSDGGNSFSETLIVSDSFGDCLDDDNTLEGATSAVGKKGEVYVVWAGHEKIYFDKSTDGGKTWGTDQIIESQPGGWNQDFKGLHRANSMPFITTNNKGHIYICWADNRNGDYDVFVKISKDGGKTWLNTQRVNNDALKNGTDQYMPHMTLDASKNTVLVTYYDRRNSQSNYFFDVMLSSYNGKKWIHNRVTNTPIVPAGKDEFFGDYIGVAAAGGIARVAYTVNIENLITVNCALLNKKILKKSNTNTREPYLIGFYDKLSKKILLNFYVTETRGYDLQIFRFNNVVYRSTDENVKEGYYEKWVDAKSFGSGWMEMRLKFKGKLYSGKVFIQ